MATIRVRRVVGAPVVAVRVWLPGGSGAEAQPGEAWVGAKLLLEGTRARGWRAISDQAEARGMAMGADAGYEAQGLALDAVVDDWELALEWAAELVRDSTFPEDRCRWIARRTAAELEQLADLPDVRTSWAFASQLYGATARGRPIQGSVESLGRMSPRGCRRFHEACLERGIIVSVAGAVDERVVEHKATDLFGDLPDAPTSEPVPSRIDSASRPRQTIELDNAAQAQWCGGAVTCPLGDSDYWPLALLGVVLGAGGALSGRISHRIRERDGLAYDCDVATVGGAGRGPGCFCVAAGVARERVEEVANVVREELDRVAREGVPAGELTRATAYVLGRDPFSRETARQQATLMAQAELLGLPLDDPGWVRARWRSVNGPDVRRVAGRYLDPKRLRMTIGKPS